MATQEMPLRFWTKVERWDPDHCWLWIGARNGRGYGYFGWEGRSQYAHRVAYQLLRAPIPEGLTIDHLCRVPSCVNPGHMEPVTRLENQRRNRHEFCQRGHRQDERTVVVRSSDGTRSCGECSRLRRAWRRAQEKGVQ